MHVPLSPSRNDGQPQGKVRAAKTGGKRLVEQPRTFRYLYRIAEKPENAAVWALLHNSFVGSLGR